MKLQGMWDGEPYTLDRPLTAYVQADWEFHNPFAETKVMYYTKGEKVEVQHLVPARKNEPFGFPFVWAADNAKPYPLWLLEEEAPNA